MSVSKKVASKLLPVMDEALDAKLGLILKTNDAFRLRKQLTELRVDMRNKHGVEDYNNLSFKIVNIIGEEERVFIVKKLSPEQVAKLMQDRENYDGS